MLSGWRGLGTFWLAILLIVGAGAAVLQVLGPPPLPVRHPAPPPRVASAAPQAPLPPLVQQHVEPPPADRPGRDTPGPIADPDPSLLESGPGGASAMLPRVAEDGRRPDQVYAAGFDHSSRRARIGILIAGIGLNQEDSGNAIRNLPGGITLAVSPYAARLGPLLTAARTAGHEYLLSIPMEPQGFPANDPGPRALLTSLSSTDNLDRLHWLMTQMQGYVGVTNALGGVLRGERFAGLSQQMDPVLADLGRRGLLYVDARSEGSGGAALERRVWSRDVDLVLDQPAENIDVNLARLEEIAHDKGSALGLVGMPSPVAVRHIAAWLNGLTDRDLVLAPVSALVRPPSDVASSTP